MTTIDQVIAEKLIEALQVGDWPIGNLVLCVIALILSAILCGAIGFERERRGRSAGLRTHLLVGIGSCIIMIISIYGFPAIFGTRDVARLAAQVIAGVGFLGAGAIIHRNEGIRGLTTAATIWIVMAIGLACGSFNFILATGGTILILVFLTAFKKIERKITGKAPLIVLHSEKNKPVIGCLLEAAKESGCEITEIRSELDDVGNLEITFMAMSNKPSFSTAEFIEKVDKIDGVLDVGLLNTHKL